MKFYLCVVKVEAYGEGFVFGRKFYAGDIRVCPYVIAADNFHEALGSIEDMCDSLDFADSTIISIGRFNYD